MPEKELKSIIAQIAESFETQDGETMYYIYSLYEDGRITFGISTTCGNLITNIGEEVTLNKYDLELLSFDWEAKTVEHFS